MVRHSSKRKPIATMVTSRETWSRTGSRKRSLLYRARDPIASLKRYLLEHGVASADELDAIDDRIASELQQAWEMPKTLRGPTQCRASKMLYVSF
ncbi:MAG: hypothetical protein R2839_05395 [Thermomicrobiales bacterium]